MLVGSATLHLAILLVLAVACGGAEGPQLQQPVGRTHVDTPPPMSQSAEPTETRMTVTHDSADEPQNGPSFRLCDLPDAAPEAPHFPPDSAVLRPRGKQILDQVANCLLQGTLADEKVIVLGFADPRGKAKYNLDLALARAQAAASYLKRLGVPEHRVRIGSHGEYYARGHGPESWQLDRRIEIELDTGETLTRF